MKETQSISNSNQIKKLGEVCTYSKGKKPAILKETKTKECSIPYINIKAFEKGIISEYTNGEKCNICEDDDLLMVWDGARCGLIGKAKKGAVGSTLMKILPKENIHKEYLYHFISSKFWTLNTKPKGVGIPHIEPTLLWNFELVVPPILEQQVIVSKIEELLSELENGKQQLLTAQQQLSIYRKSLIMQGVTGKLTANWRVNNPNVGSSEKLFQKIQEYLDRAYEKACEKAILNGKRKPKDQRKNKKTINVEAELPELPSSWNYYRLEDITYLVTDGTHFTPKYQDRGVKFLSVKNVRPFYFREEDVKYISEEEHKGLIERCNPQKDDILYTKVGATFGYAARITMDYDFSIFVSLCLIKPVKECISSKFLEFLMNSELVFKQARKRVSGSGVPDLHLIEIRDFKIPLPSIEEQQIIVSELESKLTVCDKIEETIGQSLQQAETLKQSILKKAFEGKWVTTEKMTVVNELQ